MNIRKITKRSFVLTSAITIVAAGILGIYTATVTTPSQSLGSASFQLSSGSTTYNTGSSVAVHLSVTVPPSSPAGVFAQVRINYDTSRLSFTNASYYGGFDFSAPVESGPGYVQVGAGKGSPFITGTVNIATINFTILSTTGQANLTFDSGNTSLSSTDDPEGNIWNGNTTGITFSIVNPSPPPSTPPPQPSSPSPSSTPSSPTTSTPRTTTPGATQPSVSQQAENSSTTAQLENPDEPVPEAAIGFDQGLYVVSVLVKDSKGELFVGATVRLGEQTATTDSEGKVEFSGVAAGNFQLSAEANGQSITQSIDVRGDIPDGELQEFEIAFPGNNNLVWYLSGGAALLALLGVGAFAWSKGAFKGTNGLFNKSTMVSADAVVSTPDVPVTPHPSNPFGKPPSNPLLTPPPPPEVGSVIQPQNIAPETDQTSNVDSEKESPK